jgi:hypothetical protein
MARVRWGVGKMARADARLEAAAGLKQKLGQPGKKWQTQLPAQSVARPQPAHADAVCCGASGTNHGAPFTEVNMSGWLASVVRARLRGRMERGEGGYLHYSTCIMSLLVSFDLARASWRRLAARVVQATPGAKWGRVTRVVGCRTGVDCCATTQPAH